MQRLLSSFSFKWKKDLGDQALKYNRNKNIMTTASKHAKGTSITCKDRKIET